jgi:hypothetical protein
MGWCWTGSSCSEEFCGLQPFRPNSAHPSLSLRLIGAENPRGQGRASCDRESDRTSHGRNSPPTVHPQPDIACPHLGARSEPRPRRTTGRQQIKQSHAHGDAIAHLFLHQAAARIIKQRPGQLDAAIDRTGV